MEDLKEFIFENKPTESCHASTVLPLDDGRVVVAWFAGTKESADDVDILTSVRSEGGWSEPVRVSACPRASIRFSRMAPSFSRAA